MRKNLNLVLALLAGLLGGLLTRYIAPPAAFAQNPLPVQAPAPQPRNGPAAPIQIRAQSFALTDPVGRTLGTFRFEGDRMVLRDSNSHEIWSAGGSPFRLPSDR